MKNQSISYPPGIFISILLISFAVIGLGPIHAQQGSFWDDTDLVPFEAGGSIGLSLSGYAVDGIENRRSPGVFQTFANLNFSTFGLNSGFSLNYSTDDSGLRQNMNNVGYNVNWRWLTVRAGDVSTRLSDYSLNGTPIRGGYIRGTPGIFLFEVVGGRSRRAVRPSFDSGFRQPSFEQWAFGGKIGIGKTSNDYFHLSTFYAQDNVTSLEGNQLEIKPKENLSLTPDFSIGFFDDRLNVESQVTVSVFTRDLNSARISAADLEIPGFITTLYQPYVSTRINYAGKTQLNYRSNPFDLGIGYERIQPGFISMGMANIRSDQEKIMIMPAVRFFRNRLSIQSNITFARDNLLGTRLQTQNNTNMATSFQAIFSNVFNVAGSYNLLLNDVELEQIEGQEQSGIGGQSQVSHNIMLQPNFSIMGDDLTHNFSLSGGYISIENNVSGNPQVEDISFLSESYIGMLSYAVTFPVGLTLNSSANYLTNQSPGSSINNLGINLGTSYAILNRNLTLSLQLGYNQNKVEREQLAMNGLIQLRQFTGGLNAAYRLGDKNTFNVTLRSRSNHVMNGTGNEFTEVEGSFRYQRTF